MRMRPIVMTSMAFGLGVLPLALANGAGSHSQNAIGIGVLGECWPRPSWPRS